MWRLWSDCADAQADLSLRLVCMQSCRKRCAPAHMISLNISYMLKYDENEMILSGEATLSKLILYPSKRELLWRESLLLFQTLNRYQYCFWYIIFNALCVKFSADDVLKYFSYFFQKTWLDSSLFPLETICMKCQILFSGKIRKNISSLSSAELAQRVV